MFHLFQNLTRQQCDSFSVHQLVLSPVNTDSFLRGYQNRNDKGRHQLAKMLRASVACLQWLNSRLDSGSRSESVYMIDRVFDNGKQIYFEISLFQRITIRLRQLTLCWSHKGKAANLGVWITLIATKIYTTTTLRTRAGGLFKQTVWLLSWLKSTEILVIRSAIAW